MPDFKTLVKDFYQSYDPEAYSEEVSDELVKEYSSDPDKFLTDFYQSYDPDAYSEESNIEILKEYNLYDSKKKDQEELPQEETPQMEVQEDTESVSEDGSLDLSEIKPAGSDIPAIIETEGYVAIEDFSKQEENKASLFKAEKAIPLNLGQDFDYLSNTTEEISDNLPAEIDDNAAFQFIEQKKNNALNKLGSDYYNKMISDSSKAYLESGEAEDIEEAKDFTARDYLKSMRNLGINSLGLDEEQLVKYKQDINDFYKLRQIPSSKRTLEQKAEIHRLKDVIKNLREDSERFFINPETGEIDGEKRKVVKDLTAKYSQEAKTDFQKFSERYKREFDNIRAIKRYLYDTYKDVNPGFFKKGDDIPDSDISLLESYIDVSKPNIVTDLVGVTSEQDDKKYNKTQSLLKEYEKSKLNFDALSRALLLNEDPAAVAKGFSSLEGTVIGDLPIIPFTDYTLSDIVKDTGADIFAASFGESFAEAIPGVGNVKTDRDFRKDIVRIANEEGVTLREDQYDSAVATMAEKLGDTFGTSAEIMAEIIVTTLITKNASSAINLAGKVGKVVDFFGGGKKAARIAGEGLKALEQAVAFDLTSQGSAAMGMGEFLGAKGADKVLNLLSKGKTAKFMKFFKPLTRVMGATTAGTVEEYGGEYLEQGFKNGFISKETFRNTFGRDYDEAKDKLLMTLILTGTFGTGAEVANMYKLGKDYYKDSGDQTQLNDVEKAYVDIQKAKQEKLLTKFDDMSEEELEKYAEENNVDISNLKKDISVAREAKKLDDMSQEELEKYAEENDISIEDLETLTEKKIKSDDKKEGETVPSAVEEGQEPGDIQVDETGEEEATTGGVLQEEEVAEVEADTFTEEIKELAKEENKEVLEYIEARSAEEVSEALDNNDLLSKVKNNESINESQAEEYTNKIYDLIDSENVVEGSVKESELYDVIEKIENYDNKTKTVKKTTPKTRLLTRFRKNAGKVNEKAFRDQVSGSEVEIGGSKGVLDVQGNQVFITEKGTRRSLGKAADILTQDITTDNILKDENGNVSGVRINTPSGEMIINNPEVGLDMGIQLQEKIIGRNPLSDIEVAYENVIEEEGIEVAVEKPKPKKKVEPIKSTPEVTKTEPAETKKKVSEKEVEKDLEGSFTKEEMTSKMDKTSLEKALEKVNALDNKLKNLSLSDPFLITPAARLLLAAVKKGLKVGISLEQAISNAKKEVKKSKEYKVLRKEDQNFIDNSTLDDIVSRVEEEAKGEQQKRKDTLEDELNLELEALIEESLDTKKPKTARDVRKIQKRFKDFISANKQILREASPALNATIANKLANVSSPATLKSTAEYISKIIKDTKFKKEQEARAKLIQDIRKELQDKSFSKKGVAPRQGKIASEIQDFLKRVRQRLDYTQEMASKERRVILNSVSDIDNMPIEKKRMLLALSFADIDNKSKEELDNLTQLLKEYKKEGRDVLKQKKEARAEKYKEGVDDLLTAILAGEEAVSPNVLGSAGQSKISEITNFNSKIVELGNRLASSIENWEGLLNLINRLSAKKAGGRQEARNFLKDKFVTPVKKAISQKKKNSLAAFDAIEKKKESIFGKKISKVNKDLHEKIYIRDANGNKIPIPGKKGQYMVITKNRAMYIYNLQKDPSLEATFEEMNKTKDKILIDEANKIMSENPELREYADWVHNDFYPNYYSRINEEYRKHYDYDLPFNENYSPIRRQGVAEEDIDMLSPTKNIASTLNGSLIERINNIKPIDLNRSLDETMLGYIDSMEHFIVYTDVVKFLNKTFGNSKVKEAISQKFGGKVNGIIDRFIKNFANQPAQNQANIEILSKIRKRLTTAILGLNIPSAFKQLTSIPAYAVAEGTTTFDYMKQLSMMLTTKEGIQDLIKVSKSDYIKDRLKRTGFSRDTALSFKEDFDKLVSGGRKTRDLSMFMTKYADSAAIIIGGAPYYTSMKKKYIKEGMSRAEAEEKAMFDFENATEDTQQSSSVDQLSDLQRGHEFFKLFTMFKTSPSQYLRKGFTTPLRNLMRGRGTVQDIKNIAMFEVILPSLFTLAGKGFLLEEEDREEDASDIIKSIFLGNLTGVPIFGDGVKTAMDSYDGKNLGGFSSSALEGINKLSIALGKETATLAEDGSIPLDELIEDLIIPFAEIRTGLPINNAKKLTIENLERIGKGNYSHEQILKILGWSDYSLGIDKKKKTRLEKSLEKRKKRSNSEERLKARLKARKEAIEKRKNR